MSKSDASSPDKLVDRENSACSVDTVESYSGKDGKGKDKGKGDLRKLFSLPENETLVDDFICALRRRVLYQGRLYVFEHYLCFYSNIFGHLKIVTIPLKEVTQIRKKKNYGFSNSVRVIWRGKSDVFTSFLKRDSAYKILSYAWSKSTPYAKLLGGVEEEDTILVPVSKGSSKGDSKKVLGSVRLAKLVHRPQEGGSARQIIYEDSSDDDDSMFHTGEAGGKGGSGELPSHHDSDSEAESDATDAAEGTEEKWQPVSSPAPPPDSHATVLVDTEMDVSVHDFYKEFLSDKSQFFPTWHEARGDTKVHLSQWHKHAAVGFVRELSFITPLKQKIGPSKCLCTQTQRVRLHPGDHLIFESSQIMDIPYGDYFSVETRWDFTPRSSGKKCKAQSRLSIPFSKKTMFKSTIESSTKQLCKEANDDWVAAAKKWLEPPIPMSPTAPQSAFADETTEEESSPEGKKRPTHFTRAESLKLRLSNETVPDADLLKKAPTAYRSDIARVLQLKKLDSLRQSRMSSQYSQTQIPNSYLDGQEKPGVAGRALKALRLHPMISLALVLVIILQLGYILWCGSDQLLPSFSWTSTDGKAGREATKHQNQRRGPQGQSEGDNLEQTITLMKAAIQKLQEQVKLLGERLDAKSC